LKTALFAFCVAFLIALWLTPRVRDLALRRGVVDQPGGRRIHDRPVPRWGGIAIWLGVVLAVALAALGDWLVAGNRFLTPQLIALLAGASAVAVLGMVDDRLELSARWQALGLIAVAFAVSQFGVRINYVTNPAGGLFYLGWAAVPATVVWLFGVTKTIDLIDGLDGLAAGVCAIASCALAALAILMNTHSVAIVCAAVTGASLGFLRYNYPPASIFMGTVGAQFMGFVIAGAAVIGAFKVAAAFAVLVPILALGVPLFDAVFAVARRAANGQPVYMPDRGHIHHRLLDAGLTQSQVILVIYCATVVLSAGALFIVSMVR